MARRFRDYGRAQDGFTLIEVLVTALIVTIIAGAVAGGLISATKYTESQHNSSQAENLAQQDQERLKGLSAAQLDNLNQTYTVTLDNVPYTINSKAWYLSSTGQQTCAAGGAGATYFKTISTVSVTNTQTGVVSTVATDESVIAPPAGGSLLAQFEDQTLSPLSGVTVAASGPDSDAATSDGLGCVIFSGLPTGAYNLTYTAAGYVDRDGNASPLSDTANVASTGQATPQKTNPIKLGLGGGVTANFTTTGPNASNVSTTFDAKADGLSWFSSGGLGIPMTKYRTNAPGLLSSITTTTASGPASAAGLFPFVTSQNPTSYANNYQAWAGTCLQEAPPTGTNMFTVNPGGVIPSGSAPVSEPALQLTTTYNGTNKPPTDVKITFTSGTGTSCTDTWGPETASNAGPSGSYIYGLPFASNVTSGSNASSSGQTGSVTVCADYNYSGSNYVKSTTSAFTDSYSAPTAKTIALTSTSTSGKC